MKKNIVLRSLLLLCSILFIIPVNVFSILIEDEESGTDLFLMGLGIVRVNYSSIGGNEVDFEESDRGLPDYFSNTTTVDILADGVLYHYYDVEGYLHYRERTYNYEPNLEFYLKIQRDKNYLSAGDHDMGVFTDTLFTRFEPEFRGGTIHLEGEKYGLELVGGAVRGEQAEEEIAADGSSGPYYLSNFPLVEGSETIYLRVRDKNNPSRIVKDQKMRRGVDYRIDYDDGEITFTRRVDATNFAGNPVYIRATYDYDDPNGGYNRYISGSRLWVQPHEYVRLGVTYLNNMPDSSSLSTMWDERLQVYGTDLNINVNDEFLLQGEMAISEVPNSADDLRRYAYRANLLWRPDDRFQLWGNYYRVERDFLTFGTTSLSMDSVVEEILFDNPFTFKSGTADYDLNPEIEIGLGTDEESWNLGAQYEFILDHTLTAGYTETRDNIPHDTLLPTTTSRDMYINYTYTPAGKFHYIAGFEMLMEEDDSNPQSLDDRTWRALLGARGMLGETGVTGPVHLETVYIFENYQNRIDSLDDTRTHYILARVDMEPVPDFRLYLEQDELLTDGEDRSGLTLREDTTYFGFAYDKENFSIGVDYKFAQMDDYVAGYVTDREHVVSTIITYRPMTTIVSRFKFELGLSEDMTTDPRTETYDYLTQAEIIWDITPNLILSLLYEMEMTQDISGPARDETYEDEGTVILEYSSESDIVAFYLEYTHDRSRIRTYPLDTITTDTDTIIAGGKYRFIEDWELVGGYKYAITHGEVDNHKMDGFVEVGYEPWEFLKLSVGYEYQEYYDREDHSNDFDAHIGYFKATGKF
ncbi:MAG: hypothetical protein JW885_16405 [Deltaproteobacteria bacterium]|nr:hypothetical protein [Candidatus Zymogenaceae bacterium]